MKVQQAKGLYTKTVEFSGVTQRKRASQCEALRDFIKSVKR